MKVKTGDQVKAGDLLAEFDMDLIKGEGYPVTTAVVVTNTDDAKRSVKYEQVRLRRIQKF